MDILLGTNWAPLVTDLFLFCYERDFKLSLSLSQDTQSEIIEVLESRDLDDLLNIDNQIRPTSQMLMPPFWIYIYLYRLVLLRLKFMINGISLILIL